MLLHVIEEMRVKEMRDESKEDESKREMRDEIKKEMRVKKKLVNLRECDIFSILQMESIP